MQEHIAVASDDLELANIAFLCQLLHAIHQLVASDLDFLDDRAFLLFFRVFDYLVLQWQFLVPKPLAPFGDGGLRFVNPAK